MSRSPSSALARRDADDRLADHFIARTNAIVRQSMVDTVVAVGDDLISTFFGGDLDLARSNSPRKPEALARVLVRAGEMPLSQHALRRAIAIAVQYRELPTNLQKNLSMRHQEALLVLPDTAAKVQLGQLAVARQLTSDQLVNAVREKSGRPGKKRPPGRPVTPALVKHAASLERTIRDIQIGPLLAGSALRTLGAGELALIERQLKLVREHVERIADAVGRAKG